ncbi:MULTISPECIES: hypothetical protein [Pseudomonas]|uniref:hypothetical protein n=1 Tax=Pseudomonas TaxID=286 RepID=UPI001C4E8DCE|nr:hypothetical protein [Pseudomonas sp. D1HM]MBW0236266.1 hypothetical protein [Pseudomonas sp. D1HM]
MALMIRVYGDVLPNSNALQRLNARLPAWIGYAFGTPGLYLLRTKKPDTLAGLFDCQSLAS